MNASSELQRTKERLRELQVCIACNFGTSITQFAAFRSLPLLVCLMQINRLSVSATLQKCNNL